MTFSTNSLQKIHAVLLSFALAFTLALPGAQAQDDLIIEDESVSGGSDFAQNFSGSFVATHAGGDNTRTHNILKLRYADDLGDGFSVALEGAFRTSSVELTLEEETRQSNGTRATEERKIKADDTSGEIRDAYLRYSQGALDFYVGRRTFAIGQFDAFSPIDLLLPLDFSRGTLSFSKLDNHYPQTAVSLSYFPTPQWELAVHHFPNIERDPITEELFVDDRGDGAGFNTPDDEGQTLARLIYTGENLTAGLTYYDGYEIFPAELAMLERGMPTGTAVPGENDEITSASHNSSPSYLAIDAIGFEMSIPRGRYTWKFEIMQSQSAFDLRDCGFARNNSNLRFAQACYDLRDLILTEFGGNSWLDLDTTFMGLGFDYDGEKWDANVALYGYQNNPDSNQDRAIELYEDTGFDDVLDGFFPGMHFARTHENDQHVTGFGFGFFGIAAGGTVYHNYKRSDSLELAVSFDVISFSNDANIEEQEENRAERASEADESVSVDQKSEFSPSVRFTLAYSF